MSKLLVNESHLSVSPTLALAIGLNEALVLQQIHYWLESSKNIMDEKPWVYNTYKEWEEKFPFFCNRTIRNLIYSLEKKGFLESTEFHKMKGDRTKWYTINYQKLNDLLTPSGKICHMGPPPSGKICHMVHIKTKNTTSSSYSSSISPPCSNQGGGKEYQKGLGGDSMADKMLLFWSRIVKECNEDVSMDESLRRRLMDAVDRFFDGDLEKWKSFCKRIASSKFLMGETDTKFTLTLSWALKEKNIKKILEGEYVCGNREVWPIERTEKEEREIEEIYKKAKWVVDNKIGNWQKGLEHLFFLYIKNLGEGWQNQILLKREGLKNSLIQDLFKKWVEGLNHSFLL